MISERLTYRFGPLERRGLLGPVRAGQVAVLAAGCLLAVAILDGTPTAAGAVAGMAVLIASALLCTVPVDGRTAQEWVPVLLAFGSRRLIGRTRFRSPLPMRGMTWPGQAARLREPAPRPPHGLRDIELTEIGYRGRVLGAVSERSGRRLTAVLACRVVSFGLLDADAQERRLARWGVVLTSAASTPIRRLQWVERTAPAQGDEVARWLHTAKDPAVPLRGTPIVESYLELISDSVQVARDHEILLAVQVDTARLRGRGGESLAEVLVEEAERVARGLEAAEVKVLGALTRGQLARTLRTAFDPYARSELAALEAVDLERDGIAAINAWPLGIDERWDHVRADGACHATYWIGGWPRVDVSPAFMDVLLGSSEVVRAVAVSFDPVPPARSTREVEAAVTRDRADSELRHRFGQSETARQRQAQEAALKREAELAAGHGEVRVSGYVTVSGRDEAELRLACAHVLELAARARLELHRLYGLQAAAFAFTLPLARGLR